MLGNLRKACHAELSVRKTSVKRTLRPYTISAYTTYATRLIAVDRLFYSLIRSLLFLLELLLSLSTLYAILYCYLLQLVAKRLSTTLRLILIATQRQLAIVRCIPSRLAILAAIIRVSRLVFYSLYLLAYRQSLIVAVATLPRLLRSSARTSYIYSRYVVTSYSTSSSRNRATTLGLSY